MGPGAEFVPIDAQRFELVLKRATDVHKESGNEHWGYGAKCPFGG